MNKKFLLILLIVVAFFATVLFFIETSRPTPKQSTVATTIFPIYDIARHIASDNLKVTLLLPPGASPHTFEPTPTSLKELRGAAVLYTIGHGLDDWAAKLATDTKTTIVVVDKDIQLHSAIEDSERNGIDPHYWLTVPNAKIIAMTIANDLIKRFPENTDLIRQNMITYVAELDVADRQMREIIAPIKNKKIVTLHDAWYYFAEEYGLEIAASFEPAPGREPTPQYLAALGYVVNQTGVKTIYSEPQLSTTTLQPFTEDHKLSIAILDPTGGVAGRDSFISLLIYNVQTIAKNQ